MAYPQAYSVVKADGADIPFSRWAVRLTRNEPAAWSVGFPDNSVKDFAPGAVGSYSQYLNVDPFNAGYALQHSWQIEATVGGQTWVSPTLVQSRYNFDGTAESNIVAVSGLDLSAALLASDQFMPDIRSEAGSVATAHGKIAETLANYKIGSIGLDFPDYPIQQMHRTGTPISWIKSMLAVRQAWYMFRQGQFIAQQTEFPGNVAWAFKDTKNIKLLSYQRSLDEVFNSVVVERVDAAGQSGVCLRVERSGPSSLGFQPGEGQNYTFDFPVNSVNHQIRVKRGAAKTFTYYDEAGNSLTTAGPADGNFTSGTPIHGVRFIVEPSQNASILGEYTPSYEGAFFGRRIAPPELGDFDDSYSEAFADSADQALHGPLPYPQPITNPLIPNKEVAADYARRWVAEAVRTFVSARIETLLNPLIEPGQTVEVTDFGASLSQRLFLVESVEHAWDAAAGSATTTLELSQPASLEA